MNTNCHRCCMLAIPTLPRAHSDIDTAFSRALTLDSQPKTCYKAYEKAFS